MFLFAVSMLNFMNIYYIKSGVYLDAIDLSYMFIICKHYIVFFISHLTKDILLWIIMCWSNLCLHLVSMINHFYSLIHCSCMYLLKMYCVALWMSHSKVMGRYISQISNSKKINSKEFKMELYILCILVLFL